MTLLEKTTSTPPQVDLPCRTLVGVSEFGLRCNRIFTFAHLIGFAAEHGLTVLNPGFLPYADEFEGSRTGLVAQFPIRTDRVYPQRLRVAASQSYRFSARVLRKLCPQRVIESGEFDELQLNTPQTRGRLSKRTMFVSGLYLLDSASFQKHEQSIRDYFRPIKPVRDEVDTAIQRARTAGDIIVGVHIRQGDYAQHYHGLLYYTSEEYANLVSQVERLFPQQRVHFVICSNRPQPPELFSSFSWQPGPGSAVGDLYTLAACDYIVGAASTYSQWASFYGNVPRYVHNKKVNDHFGHETPPLSLDQFHVHREGFGKFSPTPEAGA